MSRDIFANAAGVPLTSRATFGFAGGSLSGAQNEDSSNLVPRNPEMQRIVDAVNAERDIERARMEVEMNKPKNRQKALEAEMAERELKRMNFHFGRAMSNRIPAGWKEIIGEFTDEAIRVYTTDYKRRKFWGIKPAGMGMYDFWEQNDPEVGRYDDSIAITWARPLIPPPLTAHDENNPVIWAGKGLNPDLQPPELAVARAPPSTKAARKPRKRQKTPEVNSTHRVRKLAPEPSKVDKNTRKSLAQQVDAGNASLEDQVREVPKAAHANDRSTRNKTATVASNAQQKSATEDQGSALLKRPRGGPPAQTKSAANDTKRPRGRPPGKRKLAEKLPKQKKTPAVKGNARITKPSKAEQRAAPSTHKMRTRGKGSAEFLQLP